MTQMYDVNLQKSYKVGVITPSGIVATPYNHSGTPTSANDQTQGYHIGDIWITTGNAVYMCCADATGAAVWTQLG